MENNKGKALLLKELAQFQQVVTGAKKEAKNPFFKTTYADLSSVVSAIKAGCEGLNLGFYHTIEGGLLTTVLFYSDGESYAELKSSMSVDVTINGKNAMQDMGSAITYAKRYTLQSLFGLPSEDDDAKSLEGKKITPVKKEYTLDAFQKSKDKIEARFKESVSLDPLKVSDEFIKKVRDAGFVVSKEVAGEIASFCGQMAQLHNDSVE